MNITLTTGLITFIFCCVINSASAQPSPWGTGLINDQLIGTLNDTTVVFPSNSGWGNYGYYPNPNTLLPNYTFDIYIPPSYDGSKAYGLVAFINSGPNGGLFSQWQPVLDEHNLIYIAGDNIDNSVWVSIRAGVTMAAVHRIKEILNIDSTRVYASGNSGGARTCMDLAHAYPELFFGALPNCGSAYPRLVDQDYETYQPNSHYEYGLIPWTSADLAYIQSFDRQYAIMTSYNDFREGDIMNIYHNGMVKDGVKGKFLETAGFHCWTTTEQFRDAVNFVEHPHIPWIEDDFDGLAGVGSGFKVENGMIQNNNLILLHTAGAKAKAYSKDPFLWNDKKGSIFSTSIQCDSASYQQNTKFHIGLHSFEDSGLFCENLGTEVVSGLPNILTSIIYDDVQPTLIVTIENPNKNLVSDTIFQAKFADWYVSDTLDIKFHMWNQEIRMEFGRHMGIPQISSNGALLLDDNRSIRIRWDDFLLGGVYWGANDFKNGTLLTFASEAIDTLLSTAFLSLEKVSVITSETSGNTPIPEDSVIIVLSNDTLIAPNNYGPYQWYLDGVAIIGATSNTLHITQNGNYTLNAYAGSLCEVISNTVPFTMTELKLVEHEHHTVRVFPNPSQGNFTISSDIYPIEVEVSNALGQITHQISIVGPNYQMNLKDSGIYFITVKDVSTNWSQVQKLIID